VKILLVYASKYGATKKAAEKLAEYLENSVKLVNLKEENLKEIRLKDYDTIAIGGSIYAGKIQKEVTKFCSDYKSEIISKKLGLFICCGNEQEFDNQLRNSFEQELINHAITKGYFGYEYNLKKMNFLFKMIIKKMAKIKKSKFEIMEENIKKFAEELAVED
jgi:menaquinone-dependent protoporphyrinogen oxidase